MVKQLSNRQIGMRLHDEFVKQFKNPVHLRYFFAPGRINLIGEHLDYNGGSVLPCAISLGTYAAVAPRADNLVCIYSANFPDIGVIQFSLDELIYLADHGWANYPKAMIKVLSEGYGKLSHGLDICYWGNLPHGAGLSSSASIEVLTGTILNSMFNFNLDMVSIAKLGKLAENSFIGVNCGIMDQFIIATAKENHATLLNCDNLIYQTAPLNLADYSIVIANTNKRRGLLDSKYNERYNECQTALKLLQKRLLINNLCDLDLPLLQQHLHLIEDEVLTKRALHVVSENARTHSAFLALESSDLFTFGKLMNESHISLRDSYGVSGLELDVIVDSAWQQKSCVGSRMTGAGFGGCSVSLVQTTSVNDFIHNVSDLYTTAVNLKPDFYVVQSSAGAHEISV